MRSELGTKKKKGILVFYAVIIPSSSSTPSGVNVYSFFSSLFPRVFSSTATNPKHAGHGGWGERIENVAGRFSFTATTAVPILDVELAPLIFIVGIHIFHTRGESKLPTSHSQFFPQNGILYRSVPPPTNTGAVAKVRHGEKTKYFRQ